MKKILLAIVAIAVSAFSVNAQQRLVLYEEFTGENCGPCAAANPGLESMINEQSNVSKVVHVTYMEPIPTSGNFYLSQKAINDARLSYYNTYWYAMTYEFTPSGLMDGFFPDSSGGNEGNVASFTQSDINTEAAVAAPFNITATHHFNAAKDSVFIAVNIHAVAAYSGTAVKLRCAYVQSMNFSPEPGDNGETHFDNVTRAMFPSAGGSIIPATWTVGMDSTFNLKGKITGLNSTLTSSHTITISDSTFVVWIQNDDNTYFRVAQAARSTYTPTTGINEIQASSVDVNVYPNPATDNINIKANLNNSGATNIRVINTLGQVVLEKEYNVSAGVFSENLPLDNISNGVYFMTLSNNGQTATRQFTVNK